MYSLEEDAAKQLEDRPGGKSTIKLVPPPHVGMPTVGHIEDTLEPESEPESNADTTSADANSASRQTDELQKRKTAIAEASTAAAVTVARRRDGSAIAMDESGQPLDLSVRAQYLHFLYGQPGC